MPDRQKIIDAYLSGLSIPKIITKYNLYKKSETEYKWKRMRKAEVEAMYDIDFHMERSKSINKVLMEHLKQQTSPQ